MDRNVDSRKPSLCTSGEHSCPLTIPSTQQEWATRVWGLGCHEGDGERQAVSDLNQFSQSRSIVGDVRDRREGLCGRLIIEGVQGRKERTSPGNARWPLRAAYCHHQRQSCDVSELK